MGDVIVYRGMDNSSNAMIMSILGSNSELEFAGLFGSRARGEARQDSDFDILVRFKFPQGFLKLAGLRRRLSEVLGASVDLVTEQSLSPYLKDNILKEVQTIYEKR